MGLATSLRFSALVVFVAGAASNLAAQELRYGSEHPLGEGIVRTYVALDAEGRPAELGVAISETAMSTLPDLADKPPMEAFLDLDLEFPEEAPAPFHFAMFGWNPRGHEPEGVYTVPHFDFHFYTTDVDSRNAIMPGEADAPGEAGNFAGTDFEKRGMQAPATGLLPAHYVNPGGTTVPMMGGHWIDPASHEFHGVAFDKTFIYGTWDGQVIFVEPMITKAYLETKGDETIEVATCSEHAAPGWYPAAYRVRFDPEAKEYRVALTSFVEKS